MIPNNLNFVYFLLASSMSLVLAIATLRFLFGRIYAKGNKNDRLLLELMKQQGISNWKILRARSGLSNAGLWLLRDGEVDELKWGELNQVSHVLSLPLPIFLEKLGLIGESPELEACRKECSKLENQLKQLEAEKVEAEKLEAEKETLPIENFTNMVEVD